MTGRLERFQVVVYLVAVTLGLAFGSAAPGPASRFEMVVLPVVGLLLYATFTQIPLAGLPAAAGDLRFLTAVLGANFVLMPVVVWALVQFAPSDPGVRIGILLVLLVPCTDWFLTFSHLAGGATDRAVAVTPYLLLVQMLLLPVYLWLFAGEDFGALVGAGRVAASFVGLVVVPLAAAWGTQRAAARSPRAELGVTRLGRLPVPLLAVVLFLVASSQVGVVHGGLDLLPVLLVIFVAYLLLAAVVGRVTAALFRLGPQAATTLVFSLGTRNSFVVLPVALALPSGAELAVVVVVFQSLVELLGMIGYLWAVPRLVRPPV